MKCYIVVMNNKIKGVFIDKDHALSFKLQLDSCFAYVQEHTLECPIDLDILVIPNGIDPG